MSTINLLFTTPLTNYNLMIQHSFKAKGFFMFTMWALRVSLWSTAEVIIKVLLVKMENLESQQVLKCKHSFATMKIPVRRENVLSYSWFHHHVRCNPTAFLHNFAAPRRPRQPAWLQKLSSSYFPLLRFYAKWFIASRERKFQMLFIYSADECKGTARNYNFQTRISIYHSTQTTNLSSRHGFHLHQIFCFSHRKARLNLNDFSINFCPSTDLISWKWFSLNWVDNENLVDGID